ncbi:hypothetical protein Q604_UNBC15952G0002, partial [human gut metagenome]
MNNSKNSMKKRGPKPKNVKKTLGRLFGYIK